MTIILIQGPDTQVIHTASAAKTQMQSHWISQYSNIIKTIQSWTSKDNFKWHQILGSGNMYCSRNMGSMCTGPRLTAQLSLRMCMFGAHI